MNTVKLKLLQRIKIDEKLYKFVFEKKDLEFEAGQFLAVVVADKAKRYYSIASAPHEDTLDFYVTTAPGGLGSQYFESLKVGGEIEVIGPMGKFTFRSEKNAYFICTGTGIAPFISMIKDQLYKGNQNDLTLLFGNRYEESIIERESLTSLAQKYDKFRYEPALTRPSSEWQGLVGRVTEHLASFDLPQDTDFYICGGKPMVLDVKTVLMDRGVSEDKIFYELY